MTAQLAEKQERIPPPGTEERIIRAATTLFANRGFDATSTKEICLKAKVNIAAIHYHFGSKEGLFRYIIESFGDVRLQAVQRILNLPQTEEEFRLRLNLFVTESIELWLQRPEVWRIVQAEMEFLSARSEGVFKRTFFKTCEMLVTFLAEAKKLGFLCEKCDPDIAARMLFAQLAHATRTDAVKTKYFGKSLRDETFRTLWIEQTLGIFLEGVRARNNERQDAVKQSIRSRKASDRV